jgi:hypothetical protein
MRSDSGSCWHEEAWKEVRRRERGIAEDEGSCHHGRRPVLACRVMDRHIFDFWNQDLGKVMT